MSKPQIDDSEVVKFLRNRFSDRVSSLYRVNSGEVKQAFWFPYEDRELVIRIHNEKQGFEKDQYAYENFYSDDLPIPRTVEMGQFDEQLYYAITEKAVGDNLENLEVSVQSAMIPKLLNTLDAIRAVHVENDGQIAEYFWSGCAPQSTWKEYLLSLIVEFRNNDERFKGTLLERELLSKVFDRYECLIDYCPEIKQLVHGDFQPTNLLSDGHRITAVLDWECFRYGDPLYDVAVLDWWSEDIDYPAIALNYYRARGVNTEHFHERILCYKLHFGVLALALQSAHANNYAWTKAIVLRLLQ